MHISQRHTREFQQMLRFCVVGLVGVGLYSAILFLLTENGLWYMFSAAVGSIVNVTVTFWLHKHWSFAKKGKENVRREMVSYTVMRVGLFFLNLFMLFALVEYARMYYMYAQLITSPTMSVIAYIVLSRKIFDQTPVIT